MNNLFLPEIYSILNVRYSTRNMSDDEFEQLLPLLAIQLTEVDYHYAYDSSTLHKDWHNLLKEHVHGNTISSTKRVGMKLCEHFFPNFFEIKSKGKSFEELWKIPTVHEKILRWNRKSHSTPYLSELRRGVYFTQGLTKSTMYRPLIAKAIVQFYNAHSVLDPCAGWGGRMLGSVAAGAMYVGFEPNKKTYDNLCQLAKFLNIETQVKLYNAPFEDIESYLGKPKSQFDLVLTSPPYFNLEIYSDDNTQSYNRYTTYQEWVDGFLKPSIECGIQYLNTGGHSCWNVAKISKTKNLVQDVLNIHEQNNFITDQHFSIVSSKRQSNQTVTKNKKSSDDTVCFRRNT
ncbi:MAG: hypothetical protein VW683_00150 [Betaproteobacteria bacterium]|jgi:16S rRNA G966 N2-methylase RsmD